MQRGEEGGTFTHLAHEHGTPEQARTHHLEGAPALLPQMRKHPPSETLLPFLRTLFLLQLRQARAVRDFGSVLASHLSIQHLPRRNRIVRIVRDAGGGEQDEPVHALRMTQRVDGAEVRAERVPDERHPLQTRALTPLLERVDEEGLGFVHATRNVVALRPNSKRHARGATHAEPIDGVHGRSARAGPTGQRGEVQEEKAQAGAVAVQQDGRGRRFGGGRRGLDGECVQIMFGF